MDQRVWQTAYITGMEGIPWQCHHRIQGEQFIIGRELDESGKLNIVWPTAAHGNLCLSTSSLPVVDKPYDLCVEIARGTVGRLKNQTADWQRMGLKLPENFFPLAEAGTRDFLRAVTHRGDPSERDMLAQSAIEKSVMASTCLCGAFAQQALMSRKGAEGPLTTLLGVSLPPELQQDDERWALLSAFNTLGIQPDLGRVEQASGQANFAVFDAQVARALDMQMKLCMGPLVDFRSSKLPRWMILLDEDPQSILRAACSHAETTVNRYKGRTHVWNCAAGLNSPKQQRWSDEQVLRMAVALIETVRKADDRTPVLLTVEQPWSEYLRDDGDGISPLQFADALIRADLGLSGIALELSFDCWPGGSFPRDLVEVNRMLDRWAMLGLPLLIYVSSPTQVAAVGEGQRVSQWKSASQSAKDAAAQRPGVIPPDLLVQLLLSKPSVHAVLWNQFSDQYPGTAQSSGLWDAQGQPNELLQKLSQLRENFLL